MRRILLAALMTGAAVLGIPASAHAAAIDGHLVFEDFHTRQIYSVTQLGTDLTRLTHVLPPQRAVQPQWSPDGQRILYVLLDRGPAKIYTIAADGSDVQLVRDEPAPWSDDSATWLPDGDGFVFARCNDRQERCSIATVNADGAALHILTHGGTNVFDVSPRPSPDGSRIAFTRFNANGIRSQVWLMNADGTDAHPITPPKLEAIVPAWSPDGTTLTVSSNCCRLGGDIYRIPADGGAPTRLTFTSYPNFSGFASYAPSGQRIAFVSDRNYPNKCCSDLFVMRPGGAAQVQVDTGSLTGVAAVDWGPNPSG